MSKIHQYTSNDITVVVCAYKECRFLEHSIASVLYQTVPCKTVISTSTPNPHITGLAAKYNLELWVNDNPGHANDYNFVIKHCKTALCVMAHQDDILDERFIEESLRALSGAKDPQIAFTDYLEIHNDFIDDKPSRLIRIKKMLLIPAHIPGLLNTRFGKRLIQRFGDPVCHPTVTYVVDKMPKECFRAQYKSDMDWDLWERLSREKGSFVYINKVLLYHRMHNEQATAVIVNSGNDNARTNEDLDLFSRLWPRFIAKIIVKFYKKSEEVY